MYDESIIRESTVIDESIIGELIVIGECKRS